MVEIHLNEGDSILLVVTGTTNGHLINVSPCGGIEIEDYNKTCATCLNISAPMDRDPCLNCRDYNRWSPNPHTR